MKIAITGDVMPGRFDAAILAADLAKIPGTEVTLNGARVAAIADPAGELGRVCKICGCTEDNCGACVESTGQPCYWIEPDLCSACHDRALERKAS